MGHRQLNGSTLLTPRQVEIIAAIQRGLGNKQIAHELGLSEATVKWYIHLARKRTGLDRYNLVRAIVRDHERKQAIRLNEWIVKWQNNLPPESLAEIKSILAEQVAKILNP